MSIDFTRSIVAILDARARNDIDDRTVGTGFVVSADGLLVTCKHVVDSSFSDEFIYLLLYDPALPKARRHIRKARLIPDYTREVEAGDVAFLRFVEPLSPEWPIVPLPLGRSYHTKGQTFRTFGFPAAKSEDGLFGECRVLGTSVEDGIPLLQISSEQVSLGFSGAPVWDDRLQCVIGMVTSIIGSRTIRIGPHELSVAFDPDQRQTETGFITPVETLTSICPLLHVSELSPYRGLNFFTEDDADFFFGREQYVSKLLDKLKRNMRLLPVFGPSGSGKSSVVRAGLLPRLRAGELGDSARWYTHITRPADDPFKQLAGQHLLAEATDLVEGVKDWFARHPHYTRFMLVIDQFEELLLLTPPDIRQSFVRQLTALLGSPLSITVILIMRDDFYNQFVEQESLREWLERSGGATNVPPTLTIPEVTAIIAQPARAARLRFEEGLVQLIVRDMLETIPLTDHEQPVARSTNLPLLEFTLQQLWEKRVDGLLTYTAYQQIGGVTGGLTQWADEVFYGLGDGARQQQARRVLTALVRLGDENRRPPDSRRLLPLAALSLTEGEQGTVGQIVQQLVNGKLLVTTYDLQNKQEVVEIIHDALLWEWGQMRRWLEEDRAFLTWHQQMEREVQEWSATNPERPSKREQEKLLRGSALNDALTWQQARRSDLSQSEHDFIQASEQFRRRRAIVGMTGGATLAVAVSGASIWWFRAEFQPLVQWLQYSFGPYIDLFSYSGHRAPVYCVAWSPEASRLASGSGDKTVQVYTPAGEFIYKYAGHNDAVNAIAWSPDGFRIASASFDSTVRVWYVTNEQVPITPPIYRGHTDAVLAVAWSPKSTKIASGGSDTTVQIWDANSGKHSYTYTQQSGPINALAWSPDGRYIASGCGQDPLSLKGDNSVHVWRADSGETFWQYTHHTNHVLSVAWSPDGKYIASCGWDHTVQIWSPFSGKIVYTYRGHQNAPVYSVAWSADGKLIASASADKTVQVWNPFDGRTLCTFKEHKDVVNSVDWSTKSGDMRLASAGNDRQVKVWQLK